MVRLIIASIAIAMAALTQTPESWRSASTLEVMLPSSTDCWEPAIAVGPREQVYIVAGRRSGPLGSKDFDQKQVLWRSLDGGDAKPIQITNTPFAEQAGRISPDGHWIAYMSNESGEANLQLYVQSFPQPGAKQQVSTRGAIGSPRWSRDGKELFYLAPDQTLMAVSVKGSASSLESSAPTALFKAPIAPGGGRRDYDVAADGRFLINVTAAPPSAAAPAATTIVLNWAPTK